MSDLRSHAAKRAANSRNQHSAKDRLGKVADLLQRSGIDPDDIGRVEQVKLSEWEGFYKDENKEGVIVPQEATSVVLSPKWDSGPEWPVVQPCKPTVVRHASTTSTKSTGRFETAVVWPDIQIGFYRDLNDNLLPTHDEAAIAVALEVTRLVRPDRVVLIGDTVDFPELSKYRKTPSFARTTQATVDRAGLLAAEIRAAAGPNAAIDWIAGNHEERLAHFIIDNAVAAFGLRRANAPDSWPLLSVPTLCRLEEHAVSYHPGYPANRVWLNERLQVIHGDQTTAPTVSTAHRYLSSERVSTIYGHTHRRDWAERTRHTERGPRTILAASPGCLCRIDGAVPSVHAGYDYDGVALTRYENWQQGIAVVHYTPGDGPFVYEPVPIHQGWARYLGREYGCSLGASQP